MNVLELIGGILGILTFMGGGLLGFYKVLKRFEMLEESNKYRKEENVIIIKSIFAVCDGLTQLGANGPVTNAKTSLQAYIVERGD